MTDEYVNVKPRDLKNLSYGELVKIAKERGIKHPMEFTKDQLTLELGGAPAGALVYDRAEDYTYDELRQLKADGYQVPGKTVYYEADADSLSKIWAQNPMAFNNYDLTSSKSPIKFIFDRKGKCYCGEPVRMAEGQDEAVCECGKKIHYIDPDKEVNVALL
jgi:hypothetical protein